MRKWLLFVAPALLVVCLLIVTLAGAQSRALAATGDTSEPVQFPDLPWVTPYSAAMVDYTQDGVTTHTYWGEIKLKAGTTLATTMTTDESCGQGEMVVFPEAVKITLLPISTDVNGSVHRLCVVAPATGKYLFLMATKEAGFFTLEATATQPVPFSISKLHAPSKARRTQTISVWATFKPKYNGWTYPVKFFFERKVGKKWKAYSTAKVTSADWKVVDRTTFSSDGNRIKKAGTYRLRCKFYDAAHAPKNYYSKGFKVR